VLALLLGLARMLSKHTSEHTAGVGAASHTQLSFQLAAPYTLSIPAALVTQHTHAIAEIKPEE